MKLSTFALLVLTTGLASAQNLGLRAAASRLYAASPEAQGTTAVINTSVIVQGVNTEAATEADMDLVNDSVVAAFHRVYGGGDDEILGNGCGGWVSRPMRFVSLSLSLSP